jgi:nicotinamidase/pyrazinamidase
MGPHAGDALLIVDVQNDFLPGGALAVPRGNEVIEPLNRYIEAFVAAGLPVYATRDWHPAGHCSFKAFGGKWPPHCIAGTPGADFPDALKLPDTTQTVSKGAYYAHEGYSAFEDTNLANRLRMAGCRRVFVAGLATDYCVRATAMDARRLGFEVVILQDAVRAVDERPGDGARALGDLVSLGAALISFPELARAG